MSLKKFLKTLTSSDDMMYTSVSSEDFDKPLVDFYDLFRTKALKQYHKDNGVEFTPTQQFFLIYSQGAHSSCNERILDKTRWYIKNVLLKQVNDKKYRKMMNAFLKDTMIDLAGEFDDIDSDVVVPVPFKHGEIVCDKDSLLVDKAFVVDMNQHEWFIEQRGGKDTRRILNLYAISHSGYVFCTHTKIFNVDYCDYPISKTSSIMKMQEVMLSENYEEIINEHSINKMNNPL